MSSRREFITLLGGAAAAWPLAARAQQGAPVVGFFNSGSAAEWVHLVASRPTSNVTGINIFADVLTPKRQELLHELVPTAPFVAMLVNPTAAQTQSELRAVQPAADRLDQQVRILGASTDRELDTAFATIVDQRIGGLLVQPDPFFTSRRDQLVLLTTRHAIPTVFAFREFVTAGGLMSYGTSLRAAYRQLGVYAARILKGEKPADLPVQQATAFETVVNLRAARARCDDSYRDLAARRRGD